MGVAATGKKISVEGITIHHIKDGKILDSYTRWDALGLMRQLGAIPAQGRSKEAASRS
jgi:predicted ester cyclase